VKTKDADPPHLPEAPHVVLHEPPASGPTGQATVQSEHTPLVPQAVVEGVATQVPPVEAEQQVPWHACVAEQAAVHAPVLVSQAWFEGQSAATLHPPASGAPSMGAAASVGLVGASTPVSSLPAPSTLASRIASLPESGPLPPPPLLEKQAANMTKRGRHVTTLATRIPPRYLRRLGLGLRPAGEIARGPRDRDHVTQR
jgi:hypothetical protein